jgi:hypothetical protein
MLAELPTQAETPTESIRIEPITDEVLIGMTLRHPRIFPHIRDDGCPNAESLQAVLSESLSYLGVYKGDRYLGLFLVHPHNLVLHEVHTCLLPEAWGATALHAAKALIAWVFANTPCQRLVTSVPEGNLLALRLARQAGMYEYGCNPRSLMRDGVLLSQTLLGIGKDY